MPPTLKWVRRKLRRGCFTMWSQPSMTKANEDPNLLTLGLAQIAPCWMDRARTLQKVEAWVERAAAEGCHLTAFGEALVPGYPFWVELTDGARFNSPLQKEIFAEYAEQAVQPG